MASILVTGATGNVGEEVVKALQARDMTFRVGVRNVERVQDTFGNDVDVVRFDFLDESSFSKAFDGIDALFLVRPPQLANVEKEIIPALDAAIKAGVKHMVFLSLQGVENNKVTPHYKIEQYLLQADVDYTFLRAGFFMQNLSTTHQKEIRERDEIAVPVGKALTSFIDVRDIAAVAVEALTDRKHRNQSYTLTGSEALSYYQVADILSEALGRTIRYTNPSPFRFFFAQQRLAGIGYAFVVTMLYTITRFGNASEVSDDVKAILAREPISFRTFVWDYRDYWRT